MVMKHIENFFRPYTNQYVLYVFITSGLFQTLMLFMVNMEVKGVMFKLIAGVATISTLIATHFAKVIFVDKQ